MVVAATFVVTARLTGIAVRDHWRRPAAVDVAVVSGAGAVGAIVFRVGALIFDVRNLVAYGGITIGGAMSASTLTGRRFADRQAGRPRSRAGSSSTRRQATTDVVRPAVGEALVLPPAYPGKHCRMRHYIASYASGLWPAATPVLVKRSSGSSTRLPTMVVWLAAAICLLLKVVAVAGRRVPHQPLAAVAGLPARRPRPHPRQPARFG
jgi:hypothetical protein